MQREFKFIPIILNKYFLMLFILLFTGIFILIEIKNGRYWQSDFEVYYKSATRLLNSEVLYRIIEDNFYRYKYSPSAAMLFIPFTLIPFAYAKVFYTFFLSLLIFFIIHICNKLYLKNHFFSQEKILIYIVCITVALATHFTRELHLGQANIIILFLFLLSLYIKEKKLFLSAFILTLSGFIKPYFLIFIMYYLYKKEFKYLIYIAISCAIIFIMPLMFYNITDLVNNFALWIGELKIEALRERTVIGAENVSIFTFFDKLFAASTTLEKNIIHLVIITILSVFLIIFFSITRKKLDHNLKIFYDYSIIIAIIPLLISNGRSIYIFALPLFIVISFNKILINPISLGIYFLAISFIGLNVGDLNNISHFIKEYHLMPFGILLLMFLLFKYIKKEKFEY